MLPVRFGHCRSGSDNPTFVAGPAREASTVTDISDTLASVPSPVDADASGVELEQTLAEVKRVIVGQDRLVERLLTALIADGHCLLEGVPGVAKTLAAQTLATVVGGTFSRIQFTPDLVPSDIVGTRIYRASTEQFDVELGPIMANLVLADEINRAPAKVQSALLEAMAERQVSIGGRSWPVPEPFLVLATQNPIESEGVYQLPEAQRDRFLMKVVVDYPSDADELAILYRMSTERPTASTVLDPIRLRELQRRATDVFVHHALAEYVVRLILATRDPQRFGLPDIAPLLAYGASPRATLGLVAAARAQALIHGRDYVLPEDIRDLAVDVLAHRLVLTFDAVADGISGEDVVRRVIEAVPPPRLVNGPTEAAPDLAAA
ncbi:MoxR-like ATPase [Micromonospora sp. H404/HB375]|nr:ATPase, AAA family [Micromonospora sp. M42]MDH6466948.1 MoxR-like ATPase [Micromonospora sp. H404/HB375]